MNPTQFPCLPECALCLEDRPLVKSHIIPKFFGRTLKKRSGSITLVNGINPQRNPKPQDTIKVPLLCERCESEISKVETAFRNNVLPANKSLLCPIPYGNWMLKFAVSVSWRVLTYLKYAPAYREEDITSREIVPFVPPMSADFHQDAEKALEVWRAFLLDQRDDVYQYEQHIIVLGGQNSPRDNNASLSFTLFQADEMVATHTLLLGQLIILGFIRHSPELELKGTKINASGGQIGVPFTVPFFYWKWLSEMCTAFENVSLQDWKSRKGEA